MSKKKKISPPKAEKTVSAAPEPENNQLISGDNGPDKSPSLSSVKMADDTKYDFPKSGKICPRCRGTDTEAYTTKGNIQYRRCRAPVCRRNYSVRAIGKKQKN